MRLLRIALSICSLVFFHSQANSKLYAVTYEGVITSGTDDSGVFGHASSNLSGLPIKATYTFQLPSINSFYLESPTVSYIGGGDLFENKSPILAEVEIGTGSYLFDGQSFFSTHDIRIRSEYISETSVHSAVYDLGLFDNTRQNFVYTYVHSREIDFLPSSSLTSPVTITVQGGVANEGFFRIDNHGTAQPLSAFGHFSVQTLNVRAISLVPEPKTWSIFLMGFGFVGCSLRLRRANASLVGRL